MRSACILSALTLIAAAAAAQQVGDGNRNYLVNNQGSNQASPSPVTVPNCSICLSWYNDYYTADANAPVALVGATQGTIGWFTTATNSVDIGPGGLSVLLDGLDPANPFATFLRTQSNGRFSMAINVPSSALGNSIYAAMLHAAATSPDGFWLSQTHQVSFDPANTLGPSQFTSGGGTAFTNMGDDSSILTSMGFNFEFYGATYTQCYVGSNGNITFGASSTDFTESVTDMANGPRRIAVWWDDLNPGPNGYGVVRYETIITTGFATFRVSWENVPEFLATGVNSFSLSLVNDLIVLQGIQDYDIYFDYPYFNSGDGLVGITPGLQFLVGPANMVPIDLSQGPNTLSANNGYYEQFSQTSNPIDLYGHRVHFDLDPNGYPTLQN